MIIEKPDFKKWFEGSKVVDENGKPKIVYHATPEQFSLFDTRAFKSHFGTLKQAEARKDEMTAMGIGKREVNDIRIIAVYLSIRNPFRMNDLADNWKSPSALSREMENTLGLPLNSTHAEFDTIFAVTKNDTETIVKMLTNRGYDGIMYANEFEGIVAPSLYGKGGVAPTGQTSGDSYIPIFPDQIRWAT